MERFTARVIKIIRAIPPGTVMTYGQVARVAGSPRAARQVVRILHSMSTAHHLPWHRVINVRGEISLAEESGEIQKLSLQSEGITFTDGARIDLDRYQFHPTPNQQGPIDAR